MRSHLLKHPYYIFWGFTATLCIFAKLYVIATVITALFASHRYFRWGVLGAAIQILGLWVLPYSLVFLKAQVQSFEHKSVADSFWLRYVPVRTVDCPQGFTCRIEHAIWRQTEGSPFPRWIMEVQTTPIQKNHPEYTLWNSGLSNLARDWLSMICFAKTQFHSTWRELIGAFGLQHLLCFSGWHAYKIFLILRKNIAAFSIIAGAYLLILDVPFAFLCAYIKLLVKSQQRSQHPDIYWPIIFLTASIICPFCWLHTGTWLTLYYVTMIELRGFCLNRIRLSGLGWSAIFLQEIEIIPWLAGMILERYFGYIIAITGLCFFSQHFFPESIPCINYGLAQFFDFLSYFRNIPWSFFPAPFLGWVLLLLAQEFSFREYGEFFHKILVYLRQLRALYRSVFSIIFSRRSFFY